MAACFEREQYRLRGVDLLIASDVPLGAGLSSSAALEVAIGWALLALADQPIDLEDLAFTAQRAEQEFTGTRCGIMDQYIACYGVAGHALLIDCRSLEYRAVPLDFDASRVVVCDSLVKHELAAGEYNRRRAECEEGVRLLSAALPGIAALRDVSAQDFERYEDLLPEVIRRRCRHVVSEDARTLRGADALERGDCASFGRLMYESHASLRDDYEVSCRELDALVESAARAPGVDGARMTGGGFGGSTVNLVASDHLDQFEATLARDYEREFGRPPAFHLCQAEGGARED
jgi:galactokinase